MQGLAERYVRLVLAVGQHDPAFVDAYHGPESWHREAEQRRTPLEALACEASRLIADVNAAAEPADPAAIAEPAVAPPPSPSLATPPSLPAPTPPGTTRIVACSSPAS